jgi:hypothetical protein
LTSKLASSKNGGLFYYLKFKKLMKKCGNKKGGKKK